MAPLFRVRRNCPLCQSQERKILLSVSQENPSFLSFLRSEPTYRDAFFKRWADRELFVLPFEIAKCAICKFIYVVNILTDSGLKELYEEWIDPQALNECRNRLDQKEINKRYDSVISFMLSQIPPVKKNARPKLLDFGAGKGHACQRANMLGFQSFSFDISTKRVEELKAMGIESLNLELIKEHKFDAIMLDQVLEHVPNPLDTLALINQHLEPQGILFVCVPDCKSVEDIIEKAHLSQELFEVISPHQHINGFTNRSLRFSLSKSGFAPFSSLRFLPKAAADQSAINELLRSMLRPLYFRFYSTGLFARRKK